MEKVWLTCWLVFQIALLIRAADISRLSYIGCQRSSGGYTTIQASDMTVEFCREHFLCKVNTWVALTAGDICQCGTTENMPNDIVEDNHCNSPCKGNKTQMCGSINYMSVYGTDLGMKEFPNRFQRDRTKEALSSNKTISPLTDTFSSTTSTSSSTIIPSSSFTTTASSNTEQDSQGDYSEESEETYQSSNDVYNLDTDDGHPNEQNQLPKYAINNIAEENYAEKNDQSSAEVDVSDPPPTERSFIQGMAEVTNHSFSENNSSLTEPLDPLDPTNGDMSFQSMQSKQSSLRSDLSNMMNQESKEAKDVVYKKMYGSEITAEKSMEFLSMNKLQCANRCLQEDGCITFTAIRTEYGTSCNFYQEKVLTKGEDIFYMEE